MTEVRVALVEEVADGIKLLELVPTSGMLPPFTAGAHIDLRLGNGMTRSYSLVNSDAERHRYLVAIALNRSSRGGSRYIHEALKVGEIIEIAGPRNNFALVEDAPHSVLIAGGVGITPIISMIERLEAEGRSWELHYCGRTRSAVAFREKLAGYGARVALRLDDETRGAFLDIRALMLNAPEGSHFYCCGPAGMLDAFQEAAEGIDPARVHFEYFTAREAAATERSYEIVLAQSGMNLTVNEGDTILETVLAAGIEVEHNCSQGICGTCETRVLEGVPDHRDEVLTESERASNRTMMICCSGSLTGRLVLDL